jgi:hypothetical protein
LVGWFCDNRVTGPALSSEALLPAQPATIRLNPTTKPATRILIKPAKPAATTSRPPDLFPTIPIFILASGCHRQQALCNAINLELSRLHRSRSHAAIYRPFLLTGSLKPYEVSEKI